jgi:hypothetical protein
LLNNPEAGLCDIGGAIGAFRQFPVLQREVVMP